jgi:hypothetical protein
VKGFTVDTPKAVKIFRHRTKTSKFTHNLCNQTWAGFWSYDGQTGSNQFVQPGLESPVRVPGLHTSQKKLAKVSWGADPRPGWKDPSGMEPFSLRSGDSPDRET